MGRIRRYGVALVLASVMAGSMGTSLAAADKKPRPDPTAAICAYLQAIIEHPGVSPSILMWATALFKKYECKVQ